MPPVIRILFFRDSFFLLRIPPGAIEMVCAAMASALLLVLRVASETPVASDVSADRTYCARRPADRARRQVFAVPCQCVDFWLHCHSAPRRTRRKAPSAMSTPNSKVDTLVPHCTALLPRACVSDVISRCMHDHGTHPLAPRCSLAPSTLIAQLMMSSPGPPVPRRATWMAV